MRIAVVGQGGREHALAWRLAREHHEVIGVPGNPGLRELGACIAVSLGDLPTLVREIDRLRPELVVIGPEAPLAAGLADRLRVIGLTVFGPSQKATQIESSKAFAKQLMRDAGVPTARFATVRDASELDAALNDLGGAVAVKADGLAAGKGVFVCSQVAEARAAGLQLLAGGPVVVEERLEGPEVSLIGITDGVHVAMLPPARDHKRLRNGDQGPNTGGMGAVTPIPLEPALLEQIRATIFRPTLEALVAAGAPFNGALFAGLMMTPDGPKVLEFNARFGDPETQALMVALSDDVSLGETLLAAAQGDVQDSMLASDGAACGVVMASTGYPDAPRSGDRISGLNEARALGAHVFHAGTRSSGTDLETSGGRVLCVVAKRPTLAEARAEALRAVRCISFDGAQYRTDIGAGSG